jgi:hypothetical protein
MKQFKQAFTLTLVSFFLFFTFLFSKDLMAAPSNVAVIVYPQSAKAKQYARIALTRLEQVLTDNGITVLDQKKADELKKGWKKLEDPGALITAEEFVKSAGKYDIDGVYRVYLDTALTTGLAGIFTATSLTDIRFIGADAQIHSSASPAMGVKGMPPSDGLTESAAISNAVQRAIDSTIQAMGMKVLDFTNPRLFNVKLQTMSASETMVAEKRPEAVSESDPIIKLANLQDSFALSEEVTCANRSPDDKMVVVGGYLRKTQGGRLYGSQIHVLDRAANKEVIVFETAPVATRKAEEKGGSKILDCMFISNWRYLAAITNSKLFLWDVERGAVMSTLFFDEAVDQAQLEFGKSGTKDLLAVVTKDGRKVFQILRE